MSVTLQIATFAVNYQVKGKLYAKFALFIFSQGYPFMESLRSNKPLLYSILFSFSLVISLIFNIFPQLTEQFQIVLIPDDVREILLNYFC